MRAFLDIGVLLFDVCITHQIQQPELQTLPCECLLVCGCDNRHLTDIDGTLPLLGACHYPAAGFHAESQCGTVHMSYVMCMPVSGSIAGHQCRQIPAGGAVTHPLGYILH